MDNPVPDSVDFRFVFDNTGFPIDEQRSNTVHAGFMVRDRSVQNPFRIGFGMDLVGVKSCGTTDFTGIPRRDLGLQRMDFHCGIEGAVLNFQYWNDGGWSFRKIFKDRVNLQAARQDNSGAIGDVLGLERRQ